MTRQEYEDARYRYAEACRRITAARSAGQHAKAAKIARGILDLENELNAYELAQKEPEHE